VGKLGRTEGGLGWSFGAIVGIPKRGVGEGVGTRFGA